jgi:hypothetical protein
MDATNNNATSCKPFKLDIEYGFNGKPKKTISKFVNSTYTFIDLGLDTAPDYIILDPKNTIVGVIRPNLEVINVTDATETSQKLLEDQEIKNQINIHYNNFFQNVSNYRKINHLIYLIMELNSIDRLDILDSNQYKNIIEMGMASNESVLQEYASALISLLKDKKIYKLIRPDEFEKKEKVYKKLELPKEYKKFDEIHPLHIPRKEAFNYLKKRGITDEIIEKYQIGLCLEGEYAGRIIVPSFDKKGELNFFVSRSWNPRSKLKYKNPEASKDFLIFNESLIDWKKDIYLVEGVFDSFFLNNSICLDC